MRVRITFASGEMGRTLGRNPRGSRKYAWKVASVRVADFQGFLPVAMFRRMIPSDQMSLNMGE